MVKQVTSAKKLAKIAKKQDAVVKKQQINMTSNSSCNCHGCSDPHRCSGISTTAYVEFKNHIKTMEPFDVFMSIIQALQRAGDNPSDSDIPEIYATATAGTGFKVNQIAINIDVTHCLRVLDEIFTNRGDWEIIVFASDDAVPTPGNRTAADILACNLITFSHRRDATRQLVIDNKPKYSNTYLADVLRSKVVDQTAALW